jgi:glycosyltransferase involved in cell wall biosynthesis
VPSLHEGFGLPALEAMACGTPVITSGSSSLPELAVDPYDPVAMGETMNRVLADRDLREELRQRGLHRVKRFSWRDTANGISWALDETFGS